MPPMRRAKPQPIHNKIDLADPAQIRAWTRRLASLPAVAAVVTEGHLAATGSQTGGRKWIAITGIFRDLGVTPRCTDHHRCPGVGFHRRCFLLPAQLDQMGP